VIQFVLVAIIPVLMGSHVVLHKEVILDVAQLQRVYAVLIIPTAVLMVIPVMVNMVHVLSRTARSPFPSFL